MPASPYTDLDRPPLPARALQRALVVPDGLWQRLDLRAQTGSTNADAVAAARAGEPEGLVVVAEEQTGGRGRRDRQWVSPPRAGLTFSVLLRPGVAAPGRGWAAVPDRAYGWLPLLAGVATVESLRRLAEVHAVLKWPNDVLLQLDGAGVDGAGVDGAEAKCAGILAEVVGEAVVLGLGINVTTRADELPPPAGERALAATSLRLAGAAAYDRDPLLRSLLRGLARWYAAWRAADGDVRACGLLDAYREASATVGRDVRVLLPSGDAFTGKARTVDDDGQLVVRTADGERRVSAGDVLHVR